MAEVADGQMVAQNEMNWLVNLQLYSNVREVCLTI